MSVLTKRKGIDLLIEALSALSNREWNLTIVGLGPEEHALRQLAERRGLSECLLWKGAFSSTSVPEVLSQHNLCVVPSRFDGRRMAVNEAVGAGLAVAATPRVSANVPLKDSGAAVIARRSSSKALADALRALLDDPAGTAAAKERARSSGQTCAEPMWRTISPRSSNIRASRPKNVPSRPGCHSTGRRRWCSPAASCLDDRARAADREMASA